MNTKFFIEKANKVHNHKYSYDKSIYIRYHDKLIISCQIHGDFKQSPYVHLRGSGCPSCKPNKKNTLKTFIEKANKIHDNKYDYSLVIYKNNRTKIKINCKIHGIFEQSPDKHINDGNGCPKCSGKFLDKHFFIEKANKIHDNKYDYSLVDYTKSKKKVIIICSIHGKFNQKPNAHLNGQGCPECGKIKKSKLCVDEFIKNATEIHHNKYDYSLVDYINMNTKVKIICPTHNIFEQTPKTHINRKSGCNKCAIIYGGNKLKSSKNHIIIKATEIHHNKYDYSLVIYKNNRTKIKIICKTHGIFNQSPSHHLRGIGCPYCNDSKGELKIKKILEENKIVFIRNKTFDNCKDIKKLKFDFYLPIQNKLIEYDGVQHFKSIEFFGGDKELINTQRRDKIKDNYGIEMKIPMLRIKYNENLENKLLKFLNKI